ncbi:MAG TPA: hypothetical protein VFU11_07915 [Solirubrobacterales bacterium]|nr:hypothetical protein [Solirubrobacterales bacterium]
MTFIFSGFDFPSATFTEPLANNDRLAALRLRPRPEGGARSYRLGDAVAVAVFRVGVAALGVAVDEDRRGASRRSS